MFSAGEGVACPKCMGLTDSPEEDAHTPENDKLEILEQKLQESESKLETTVVVRLCSTIFCRFKTHLHCLSCRTSVKMYYHAWI
jgi:hypothetical protein